MTATPLTKADLLGSPGAFNPIRHIVLAFVDDAAAGRAARALRERGFADADLVALSSDELRPALERVLRQSSGAAGFGYEVTLLRRYIDLAAAGAGWLVVHAPEDAQAELVRDVATRDQALAGVRYHRLASEELIDASSKREQL